jgi:hypothetical protein
MDGKRQKRVVSPREFRASLREIVRRDYFPTASGVASGEHVDEYLSNNLSENQVVLQTLMKKSAGDFERNFTNKTCFLRPVEPTVPLLKDNDVVARDRPAATILRENTRFEAPRGTTRRSLLRREDRTRDDLDLLSVSSKSTTRSTLRALKPMSETAAALMDRLQQASKRHKKAAA